MLIYGGISISVKASAPTRIDLVGVSVGVISMKENVYEHDSNRNKFNGFRMEVSVILLLFFVFSVQRPLPTNTLPAPLMTAPVLTRFLFIIRSLCRGS